MKIKEKYHKRVSSYLFLVMRRKKTKKLGAESKKGCLRKFEWRNFGLSVLYAGK